MQSTKGISRHLLFDINNQRNFNDKEIVNDKSPYRYIKYHDEPSGADCFFHKALYLAEVDITHEILGLNLVDLLNFDYSTFRFIEKRVHDIRDQRRVIMQEQQKKAEENKRLQGEL